eukprot:5409298-Amphidinium_carterae.1
MVLVWIVLLPLFRTVRAGVICGMQVIDMVFDICIVKGTVLTAGGTLFVPSDPQPQNRSKDCTQSQETEDFVTTSPPAPESTPKQ